MGAACCGKSGKDITEEEEINQARAKLINAMMTYLTEESSKECSRKITGNVLATMMKECLLEKLETYKQLYQQVEDLSDGNEQFSKMILLTTCDDEVGSNTTTITNETVQRALNRLNTYQLNTCVNQTKMSVLVRGQVNDQTGKNSSTLEDILVNLSTYGNGPQEMTIGSIAATTG